MSQATQLGRGWRGPTEEKISTAASERWFSFGAFATFLALALFACFPEVLMGRESFFFRDYGVLGFPFVRFHHECFWKGELPLWNPLSNCGAPFLAQWGTMALYPFSLIYLLLPLPWSLSLFCFFHTWLGGIGMYLLARRWTDSPFAGCVGGTAYVFSGITFASFIWPNYLVALGWMPFVVLLAERSWRHGGRVVIAAGVVAALQLGSGAPEVILFTWLIIGAFMTLDFAKRQPGSRMTLRIGMVVVIAAGLMAAQLLPFFDLLQHSQRDRNFGSSRWSLPLWGWANFIVPLFHSFETPQGQYFQYGQGFLSSVYLGASVVALAICAVVLQREPRVWVLATLVVFAVVMAFGDQTPFFTVLRKALPFVGVARFPVKFLFIAAFLVPLLAAIGVAALESRPRGWRILCASAATVLLVGALLLWLARKHWLFDYNSWPENFRLNVWLSWKDAAANAVWRAFFLIGFTAALLAGGKLRRWRIPCGIAALALLAADVRSHTPKQIPTLPSSELAQSFWPKELLRPRHCQSRVMISAQTEEALLHNVIRDPREYWRQKRRALWSNLNLLEEIPKVNGSSTLQLRWQAELQNRLYGGTNQPPTGLLDFLGVAYITAPDSVGEWISRTYFLPLVTAGQRPVFASANAILDAIARNDFNPRTTVYLPEDVRSSVPATNAAQIEIISQSASINRVEATVLASEPGMIVVAQSFHTRWRATIDGEAVPLLRANHAFQAIPVPAGQQVVRVIYVDSGFRLGMIISLVTLVLCVIAFVWMRCGTTPRQRR